nr:PilZ domain-containing protein [candidate division Zixibacteria bacterium]
MAEKRRLERRNTLYYLKVFDRNTRRLTGRLTDITTEGMKLVSDKPIEANRSYKLRIVLPEPIRGKNQIVLDAVSVWSKPDPNPAYYGSGFRFTDILPESRNTIENSFDSYLFPDWRTSF